MIVWRHGVTAHNASGVYQGHLDTELTDRGHRQAAAAAAVLAGRRPSRVVCSDLRRAAQTAAALSRACGVEVAYDPRLREIDVGTWGGLGHEEVRERYPREVAAMAQGEDVRRGEHGEDGAAVGERTRAAVDEALETLEGNGDVLVVATHGMAARALVGSLLQWRWPGDWAQIEGLGNAHWAEVVRSERGWMLHAWNASAPTD
ncbi:MAG: histidine phosphatase family protein [Ornithinimicrobium sp.]